MRAAVVTALALMATTGCGATAAPAKAPEKCPPQSVTVALLASPSVNPTAAGEARPVVVRVYQLKSDARLLNATFEQIWHDDKRTLEDDLVKVNEVQLYPSSRADLKFERTDAVVHVAAAALFQSPAGRNWLSIFDLPPLPEGGKCWQEACDGDDCDDRPVQNPVFSFWIDGAKVDDGVEHLEEYPRPGRFAPPPKKPSLLRAAPERRP